MAKLGWEDDLAFWGPGWGKLTDLMDLDEFIWDAIEDLRPVWWQCLGRVNAPKGPPQILQKVHYIPKTSAPLMTYQSHSTLYYPKLNLTVDAKFADGGPFLMPNENKPIHPKYTSLMERAEETLEEAVVLLQQPSTPAQQGRVEQVIKVAETFRDFAAMFRGQGF